MHSTLFPQPLPVQKRMRALHHVMSASMAYEISCFDELYHPYTWDVGLTFSQRQIRRGDCKNVSLRMCLLLQWWAVSWELKPLRMLAKLLHLSHDNPTTHGMLGRKGTVLDLKSQIFVLQIIWSMQHTSDPSFTNRLKSKFSQISTCDLTFQQISELETDLNPRWLIYLSQLVKPVPRLRLCLNSIPT